MLLYYKAENYKFQSTVTHILATFYFSLSELSPDEFRSTGSARHFIPCKIVPRLEYPYTTYCITSSSPV